MCEGYFSFWSRFHSFSDFGYYFLANCSIFFLENISLFFTKIKILGGQITYFFNFFGPKMTPLKGENPVRNCAKSQTKGDPLWFAILRNF